MPRTFLATGDNSLYNWALNFSILLTAKSDATGGKCFWAISRERAANL